MYGHQGRQLYNPDSIEDCHEHLLYSVSTTGFELHESERGREKRGREGAERRGGAVVKFHCKVYFLCNNDNESYSIENYLCNACMPCSYL